MKILVEVKLKSKKNMVEKMADGHFVVFTNKEARENMANNDVLLQLSKYFKVPKSNIHICLGQKLKKKIVEIDLTKK